MGTAAKNARPAFADISRPRAERMAAGSTAYPGGMTVRVSYAGEVTLEEAVSHYLAARQNAMEAIGPARASLYACVEPIAATLLSAFWLHEPFALIDLLGFAMIIATILILGYSDLKAQ